MGKKEGKMLTNKERNSEKRNGLPKPLRRRGCERKREEKKADHSSSEGGDVPGGIQKAVGWGDKRGKI